MVEPLSVPSWDAEPTTSTISQAAASTTVVRMAVARLESVCRTPTLARMAVSPANNAEAKANAIHTIVPSLGPPEG